MKTKNTGKKLDKGRLDLTLLQRSIEKTVQSYLNIDRKPGLAIAITLPPDYCQVYWIANLGRSNAIELFEAVIDKLRREPVEPRADPRADHGSAGPKMDPPDSE